MGSSQSTMAGTSNATEQEDSDKPAINETAISDTTSQPSASSSHTASPATNQSTVKATKNTSPKINTDSRDVTFARFAKILSQSFKTPELVRTAFTENITKTKYYSQCKDADHFITTFLEHTGIEPILINFFEAYNVNQAQQLDVLLEKYHMCTKVLHPDSLLKHWITCLLETSDFSTFTKGLTLLTEHLSSLLATQEMSIQQFVCTLATRMREPSIFGDLAQWATQTLVHLQKLAYLRSQNWLDEALTNSQEVLRLVNRFTDYLLSPEANCSLHDCADTLNALSALPKPTPQSFISVIANQFVYTQKDLKDLIITIETKFNSFFSIAEFVKQAMDLLLQDLAKTGFPTEEQEKTLLRDKFMFLAAKEPSLGSQEIFVSETDPIDPLNPTLLGAGSVDDFLAPTRQKIKEEQDLAAAQVEAAQALEAERIKEAEHAAELARMKMARNAFKLQNMFIPNPGTASGSGVAAGIISPK